MASPGGDRSPHLPDSWLAAIGDEFRKDYIRDLRVFLESERSHHRVFPKGRDMFNAFWCTPFDRVRVVILGQDPYHGPGQAHGLCFSVTRGVRPPPSLQNIFKELHAEFGIPLPRHGDLTHWAKQGVLLLNTVLSVRAHSPNSHRGRGWETLTDAIIAALNAQRDGLIFVLWGSAAGRKAAMIDQHKHRVLKAPHPSPLSAHRGFMGCGHFRQINDSLILQGSQPIEWQLPE